MWVSVQGTHHFQLKRLEICGSSLPNSGYPVAKVMMVVIRLQIKAQLSEDVVKCIYNSVNRTQNIYSKSLQKCIYSRNEAQKSIKLRGKNLRKHWTCSAPDFAWLQNNQFWIRGIPKHLATLVLSLNHIGLLLILRVYLMNLSCLEFGLDVIELGRSSIIVLIESKLPFENCNVPLHTLWSHYGKNLSNLSPIAPLIEFV